MGELLKIAVDAKGRTVWFSIGQVSKGLPFDQVETMARQLLEQVTAREKA